MSLDEIKAKRLKEKEETYGSDPTVYSLDCLVQHFLAEVGKLQHEYYHISERPDRTQLPLLTKLFADVSNLHDMVASKLKEEQKHD